MSIHLRSSVVSRAGASLPDFKTVLTITDDLSIRAGRLAHMVVNTIARREALACGVYCFPSYCPSGWCAPAYPNEFSCHNYCTGTNQDFCGSTCTGFCWMQQC